MTKKSIIILIILGVLTVGILFLYNKEIMNLFSAGQNNAPITSPNLFPTLEESKEVYDVPSDIEGMTMYDKIMAGLNPLDESDTDADGLTDKEEVEVYGTDPLKASTADDLYTDGEKVEQGMDLFTYYDRDDTDIDYIWNECPEIQFHATQARAKYAVANDTKCTYIPGNYEVFRQYRIYYLDGKLTIDITGVLEENGLTMDDITVVIGDSYDEKIEEVSFTSEGNQITPDREFEYVQTRLINICRKMSAQEKTESFAEGLFHDAGEKFMEAVGLEDDEFHGGQGLMTHVTLSSFLGVHPTLLYVPTGDEKIDRDIKKILVDYAYKTIDRRVVMTVDEVKEISYEEYKRRYRFLSKLPDDFFHTFYGRYNFSYAGLFYEWFCLADITDYGQPWNKDMKVNGPVIACKTGFDIEEDTFNFPNYSTDDAYGHCVGLSMIMAQLFNDGKLYYPVSTNFNLKMEEDKLDADGNLVPDIRSRSYDITNDPELATLMDYGLNDFKDSRYPDQFKQKVTITRPDGTEIKKNLILPDQLQGSAANFFNLVSYYQRISNVDARRQEDMTSKRWIGTLDYEYTFIENIKKEIKAGYVVIMAASCFYPDECRKYKESDGKPDDVLSNGGHCVLLYGYREAENDPDITYFDVYDCNYPKGRNGENEVFHTMKVKKTDSTCYKGRKSFIYEYAPCPFDGDAYVLTNDPELVPKGKTYHFIAETSLREDLNPEPACCDPIIITSGSAAHDIDILNAHRQHGF